MVEWPEKTYGNNRKDHSTPVHFISIFHDICSFHRTKKFTPTRAFNANEVDLWSEERKRNINIQKPLRAPCPRSWAEFTHNRARPPIDLSHTATSPFYHNSARDAIYIANWEETVKEINNCLLFHGEFIFFRLQSGIIKTSWVIFPLHREGSGFLTSSGYLKATFVCRSSDDEQHLKSLNPTESWPLLAEAGWRMKL